MTEEIKIRPIARIETDLPDKFGVPRQSGLVSGLRGRIVFEPEYRSPEAVRGLEGFTHIWLIWYLSRTDQGGKWSPTVRPPRLGGNTRMGVFATRSTYRPNPIALSSVALEGIESDEKLGPVLIVRGADLLDGTPIIDIKPYIPAYDSHPEASGGFTDAYMGYALEVDIPDDMLAAVPEDRREALRGVLANDPRPSYQDDPERVYGMRFAGLEVKFRVSGSKLTVVSIGPDENQ